MGGGFRAAGIHSRVATPSSLLGWVIYSLIDMTLSGELAQASPELPGHAI